MKKLLIILITLVMFSCSDNSSYFDLEKKGLISCHNTGISSVLIEGSDGNFEFYLFKLKENKKRVTFFSLDKISEAFNIIDNKDNIIDPTKFRLKPSTKYKITNRTVGDAVGYSIVITTNEKGIIETADKTTCN